MHTTMYVCVIEETQSRRTPALNICTNNSPVVCSHPNQSPRGGSANNAASRSWAHLSHTA